MRVVSSYTTLIHNLNMNRMRCTCEKNSKALLNHSFKLVWKKVWMTTFSMTFKYKIYGNMNAQFKMTFRNETWLFSVLLVLTFCKTCLSWGWTGSWSIHSTNWGKHVSCLTWNPNTFSSLNIWSELKINIGRNERFFWKQIHHLNGPPLF